MVNAKTERLARIHMILYHQEMTLAARFDRAPEMFLQAEQVVRHAAPIVRLHPVSVPEEMAKGNLADSG